MKIRSGAAEALAGGTALVKETRGLDGAAAVDVCLADARAPTTC